MRPEILRELPSFSTHAFRARSTKYAVLIPVLNEGDRIRAELGRMKPYFGMVDTIIVDGGSIDGSADTEYLKDTGVSTLLVKTGYGKLSAQLRIGLAHCMEVGYEG